MNKLGPHVRHGDTVHLLDFTLCAARPLWKIGALQPKTEQFTQLIYQHHMADDEPISVSSSSQDTWEEAFDERTERDTQ